MVQQFTVHLENEQHVYFTDVTVGDQVSRDLPETSSVEFFKLCQVDNFAKTLFYIDVPKYYTHGMKNLGTNLEARDKELMLMDFLVLKKHMYW